MKNFLELQELPSYLQDDAVWLAIQNEDGLHDYDFENVGDDFVFEYDSEEDKVISALYRRFQDGGIAF